MSTTLSDAVRDRARELLSSGTVRAILAWRPGPLPGRAQPALFHRVQELDRVLVGETGDLNLAVLLTRPQARRCFPVALLARPADLRSVLVLLQEGQLEAENVRVITVDPELSELLPDDTVAELLPWLREAYPGRDFGNDALGPVRELQSLSLSQRWGYWKEQLARCIRCYACRQVCPLCYCERCIVELGQPQWLEPSPHQRGNLNWNLIRALHLAGRCTLCGACESACPVDIPLMTLNRMVAHHVWNEFGYAAGLDPEVPPLLSSWQPEDSNELFR